MRFNYNASLLLLYFVSLFLNHFINSFAYKLIFNKARHKFLLIEYFVPVLNLLVFIRYGFSFICLCYFFLTFVMYFISCTDIYNYDIYDLSLLLILFIRLLMIILLKENLLHSLLNGLFISVPLLLLVIIMNKVYKKQTMGGGDIKLLFVLGTYFNLYKNVYALLLACIISLIYLLFNSNKKDLFAFGPAICLAYYLLIVI